MLLRFFLLYVLCLAYYPWLAGQAPARAAYEAQSQGQYTRAISIYDSLLQAGHESADLHYNLSLAYYRAQDFGRAMLHVEKAARLAPYRDEIQTNLRLLRNEQADGILPLPKFFLKAWMLSLGARLGPDSWGVLALLFALLALAALGGGLRGWAVPLRKFWPAWLAGLLILSLWCVLLASYRQSELARREEAIVLPTVVDPRVAPAAEAESQFNVHAGLRVRILDRFEGWIKIQLADGREGWLAQEEVGVI